MAFEEERAADAAEEELADDETEERGGEEGTAPTTADPISEPGADTAGEG
ncbi:hypothetical protein K3N28_11355 [Glycomyces sp. TRM65418]|nr:hypothetical protein [Glycomyces sp. TRM65418]MCC3763666.1 hypothetical protein [Glycomyces sp. TRM65418]QZD57648.1 hypothetical protein K3N28_11295 [Glycomyces sp. TRM65418]